MKPAASRRRVYIGRPEYMARLDAHAGGDGLPLVLTGESGGGKSALLASHDDLDQTSPLLPRHRLVEPFHSLRQERPGGTDGGADRVCARDPAQRFGGLRLQPLPSAQSVTSARYNDHLVNGYAARVADSPGLYFIHLSGHAR